jgi:hypothetical protein
MTIDEDAAAARKRDRLQRFHRENLDRLAESTRKLREHNDEVETKARMRQRGSIPPAKGST